MKFEAGKLYRCRGDGRILVAVCADRISLFPDDEISIEDAMEWCEEWNENDPMRPEGGVPLHGKRYELAWLEYLDEATANGMEINHGL